LASVQVVGVIMFPLTSTRDGWASATWGREPNIPIKRARVKMARLSGTARMLFDLVVFI
jgi:hypothetical protein